MYQDDSSPKPMKQDGSALVSFVMGNVDQWRQDMEQEYHEKWNKYERLYYGQWAKSDKTRSSERSQIITPALQQAVEQYQAEVSEAVFGSGSFFDVEDEQVTPTGEASNPDIEQTRKFLDKEFKRWGVRKQVDLVIFNGAVYDGGFAEIAVETVKLKTPDEVQQGEIIRVGVREVEEVAIKVIAHDPRNVLYDTSAGTLDESLGVAIRKPEPRHLIEAAMESGLYADCDITEMRRDELADANDTTFKAASTVVLTRYFGKVPRKALEAAIKELEGDDADSDFAVDGGDVEPASPLDEALGYDGSDNSFRDMVEAIVVIANDSTLLKAEANPFMMQDRPIIHFTPEPRTGKVIGRGIAAKAYNMQMASDSAIRMHLDAMAFTASPVFALDGTRLPRGMKLDIYPGRTVHITGTPTDFIQRLDMGTVSPEILATSKMFERMLLQATGTIDAAGMTTNSDPSQRGVSIAIALAGIIKRHKRTLVSFQEEFVIPMINKVAWRYMQYAPTRIKSRDFNFIPMGTLGMVAREYEQQMLLAMLSTLGPDSPIVPLVLASVLDLSSLRDRDTLTAKLRQMAEPNPEEIEMRRRQQELGIRDAVATVVGKEADVSKKIADTDMVSVKTRLAPLEVQAKLIAAASNNLDADPGDRDFSKRVQLTKLLMEERKLDLQERDIESNQMIAEIQSRGKAEEKGLDALIKVMSQEEEIIRDNEGNVIGKRKKNNKE